MPLPRLTTRRLLAFVAVVGLVLAVEIESIRLWQRHQEYERLAVNHAWRETILRLSAAQGREFRSGVEGPVASPARIAEMRRAAEYEAVLKRKYHYASRHPWLTVLPDRSPP